ncbi:hypothetical protein DY218_25255 [Streptomyces triticagri]|uniref:Luciferase domain-containing protein n=1 Tax=Streptomyces triticagri TaxID=2293568 RepID=A0A372M087_9ACTN|nr:luciferase family protein [Streptomyces triticagri]RFU84030.1 hypothetical protein DY218_25255 [Streptomyces triticagri]
MKSSPFGPWRTAVGLGAVTAAAVLVRRDYRRWQSLGEGGIPWGVRGWIKMTGLRLRAGDPLDVAGFPDGAEHPDLKALPQRGARPRIAPHPVPHRQLDQDAPSGMLDRLQEVFDGELRARDGEVEERQSQFELHNPAFFVPAAVRRGDSVTGEVAHFHRPQGSLHLHLHPADVRPVVERGWGELHGLAGRLANLPASYTLLYAPRDAAELDAVRTILRATLDRATGDPADA